MIERTVLDCIHDYIEIDETDFKHLQNNFAESEFLRLREIAHLGLIGKLRPLVRHDKLEHAYGTYWLCRQCAEHSHGLIDNKKAFRLAGLMHGIGHFPFSYTTEYAVAKLYQFHEPVRNWLTNIFQHCIQFLNNPSVEVAANRIRETADYSMLHRWIGTFKMARSTEFNNDLGRQIARILVDTEMLEHRLLHELDRLDYVLRDMHYLALGRIELNFTPLLAQFAKDLAGELTTPKLLKLIETTYDALCEQIYLGPEERCLAQAFEKPLVKRIVEGTLQVEDLLGKYDDELESMLSGTGSDSLVLGDVVRRIKNRKLVQVARMTCELGGNSLVELEADLAGTNKAGVHKYYQSRGVFVECVPNPYCARSDAYEWTTSAASIGIAYDFDSISPHHVIGSLLRAERWAPDNRYGTQLSCREDALRFLLGLQVSPQFNRYYEDVRDLIMKHMPKPKDEWKRELFHESWASRDWAVFEAIFYEYDIYWPAEHFLRFPEHWNTKILTDVLTSVDRSRARRRPREDVALYNKRAQRLLEYSTYLQTVLKLRQQNLCGWVLPSVVLLTEDGKQHAEIDVIAVYVRRAHSSPVTIDLLEVSLNSSPANQEKARKTLDKVTQTVRTRFRRNVSVGSYFNGQNIVSWPCSGRRRYQGLLK